ncbi:sugar phosphate isomerase/epimerase [soil metagenome]|nr:sugar phosphate isomerase/epimerase [Trueperaceae bacterium]
MKFAVHAALWMREWDEDVAPLLDAAARIGFDGVELSLLGMDDATTSRLRSRASELGLEITCTTGLAPHQDVTSDDATVRASGTAALRRALHTVQALGAKQLSGVVYAPWGVRRMTERSARWGRAVEALAGVAPLAAELGITLGVEAINRYETDLVTTAADATRMAAEVDHPHVGVLLDTYHMNIEEKDVAEALRVTGDRLVHLHVVENDRGVPGSGHVPWDAVVEGVRAVGYDGWATLEMFVLANQSVSPDLAIWRDIEDDPTDAAHRGLAFLRERFG